MTEPEHVGNEAEQIIAEVWWHSKTFVGSLFAHLLTASGSLVGLLMDHHAAATIVPAQLASHVAIHTGVAVKGAAVERAQANSFAYAPRGQPYPPPPPVVIPPTVTSVTITPATGSHLGSPPPSS